jgi:hypothetical protein
MKFEFCINSGLYHSFMKQQLAYSNFLLSIVYHLKVWNKNMSSLSGDWNWFVLVHNVVQMYIKFAGYETFSHKHL